MDHERVVEALTLWGCWSRAVRVGPPRRRRCGSLESRWIPPAGSVFDDDYRGEAPRIADDLALAVERAVVARCVHIRTLVLHGENSAELSETCR